MRYLRCIIPALALFLSVAASAQTDKREVRRGNREFRRGEYQEADISYRKALVKDSTSFAANYNLANTLYRQENIQEATARLQKIAGAAPVSPHAADYYFNLGDCALAAQDWQGAIQAFMQVLLRHPDDMEAKENLAYAKLMQQDQEGGGGQNDQNQDQNQQDQNQDQNQNQNQDQNQDQNQQNQDQQNQNQNQQNGQQPVKISPQQAQQMLQAIQAKEKETQDKVQKAEAAAAKARQKEKNW